MKKITCWVICFLSGVCLAAELSLPTVFSDHMVLQRDQQVPVWGKAAPGSTITVEFAGQTKTAVTDSSNQWKTFLDPMPASSNPRKMLVSSDSSTPSIQYSNLLVGEVWLCSGQSNMGWGLFKTENADEVIAASGNPLLRLYKTPTVSASTPQDMINASWTVCSPETAAPFSGVAYYFGQKLQRDLGVPVGLLLSAWGGTRIVPWTPPCGFQSVESLADLYEQTQNPAVSSEKPGKDRKSPSVLYHGMIHAHIPYAIRGAIWYQGESDHRDGAIYLDQSRALINGWRKLWGYEFPFYLVQLAPFDYKNENFMTLPAFWEVQAEIVKTISNTGMAVISDAAALDNIHPPNKEVPGTRLALLAEAGTYGMDVVSSGPVFQALEKEDEALRVIFNFAEGLTTRDGNAPDWFEIAGEDGVFKMAQAEISGESVFLRSPDVSCPQWVRFAWSKLAMPNLMNSAGLPAHPFQSFFFPKETF